MTSATWWYLFALLIIHQAYNVKYSLPFASLSLAPPAEEATHVEETGDPSVQVERWDGGVRQNVTFQEELAEVGVPVDQVLYRKGT